MVPSSGAIMAGLKSFYDFPCRILIVIHLAIGSTFFFVGPVYFLLKVRQHLSGAVSRNSRFLAIKNMVFMIYISS